MAPGDYRVLAFSTAQPHLAYRDAEAMKAYESKGPVVHLTAGQKTTVQVETISSE
jgi:TPP-dependent pyruvate/acetoin dehydrogenase alpha subunit